MASIQCLLCLWIVKVLAKQKLPYLIDYIKCKYVKAKNCLTLILLCSESQPRYRSAVVECLTLDPGVAGKSLTEGTALHPVARRWASTKQSQHDRNFFDWDANSHNQTNKTT